MMQLSLLAVPLDKADIEHICARHPEFQKELPMEASFWSVKDIDEFVKSNGEKYAPEIMKPGVQTCRTLSMIRRSIAEKNISAAPPLYVSYSRYLRAKGKANKLSTISKIVDVKKVDVVTSALQTPVILVRRKEWRPPMWNLDFWDRHYGNFIGDCSTQSSPFEHDAEPMFSTLNSTVKEFIKYARILQRMDPRCIEESSLSYYRMSMSNLCPFASVARKLWEDNWENLTPPGICDLTPRCVEGFLSEAEGIDANTPMLERFYDISFASTGVINRLRCENHNAHAWFIQLEGWRVFYLFSPEEAHRLYPEFGNCITPAHTTTASPVDVFQPDMVHHPMFSEAKAEVAVLHTGDTLVVPSGWWHFSVVLAPSVTLRHRYYSHDNWRDSIAGFKIEHGNSIWTDWDWQQIVKAIADTLPSESG